MKYIVLYRIQADVITAIYEFLKNDHAILVSLNGKVGIKGPFNRLLMARVKPIF